MGFGDVIGTIGWQEENEIGLPTLEYFYCFYGCFVEKCSVLEGHKVTYGLIRNEIMLGNGTLPVAALTLSEP